MIKCVNEDCDYFKHYGECSSACENQGFTKILTNYDRIQSMTVDEMAAFCARNFGCKNCEARELCRKINSGDCIMNCFDNVKQWLESEAE